jgi:hypothetical protein
MNDWSSLGILSLAQAHLVYLLVNSQLSHKLQARFKVRGWLKELLSCPVCTGFWAALGLARLAPIETLAIGFLGGLLYEAKEKLLPCAQCKSKVDVSKWRVV